MKKQTTLKLSFMNKLGYSTGNLGFGIVYQVVVSYLVFYSTVVLKLPGSLIGTVVAVGVIWDAVTDPAMGFISDNTKFRKFGRRHAYLLIGGATAAITNFMLWSVKPEWSDAIKIIWILSTLLLVKTALTIYATPYTALGAELSRDYDERSSIQGMRTIFFLLGVGCASVLVMAIFFRSTPLYAQGQLNPEAYPKMGIATSVIMMLTALSAFFTTRKFIPLLPVSPQSGGKENLFKRVFTDFAAAFKNRNYTYVVAGYLFTNIITALVTSLGLHVFTYTFGLRSSDIATIFAVLFLTSIVSQPLWVWVSKKLDKKPTVIVGLIISLLSGLILLYMVFLKDRQMISVLAFIPFSVLMGLGSGGLYSLPLSMIADTIDIEEMKTGKRSEGVYYGLMTFSYKASQSIVIFIVGLLLDAIGFNAELPVQSESTSTGLGLIMGIGGLIAVILCIIFYNRYSLTRSEIKKIQNAISNTINPDNIPAVDQTVMKGD